MLHTDNGYASNWLQKVITKPNLLKLVMGIIIFATLDFHLKAAAQSTNITSKEINSYAQAVLAMEPSRQKAFEEIKTIIGSKDVPPVICTDPKSFYPLPNKAKKIAAEYCDKSKKIVEGTGLTVDKFNSITLDIKTNSELKSLVYKELLRLQKTSK
ncbi:DUF4168 domain-containing protein [Anabaena sp. FACHB-1237]|uniref:DUF4168 domain-containing protein n=1 Tax=Anabaena sp. FACHB-1237 TaxID=2692769 RepID=UPI001681BFC4|nr:DUF4168 domain-containing protein [Anabaena sp. FACHB-1237]MBD2138858.1 DUF4168 domain-containing protein [Anabaena sp. FACHB-1237]